MNFIEKALVKKAQTEALKAVKSRVHNKVVVDTLNIVIKDALRIAKTKKN